MAPHGIHMQAALSDCLSVCLSVCCHSCSERRAAHYTKVYRRFLKPPSKAIARKDLVPALREVHFGTVDEEQIIEVLQVRESGASTAHVPHSPSLTISMVALSVLDVL